MAGTLTVQNIEGPSSGANANKVIIPSGQTLDVSAGTLTPSAGQVIQKVHHTWSSTDTNSTETFADVNGSSFSFTPKSSTSRLFITAHYHFNAYSNSEYYAGGMVRIVHDGTVLDYANQQYEGYYQQPANGDDTPNIHMRQSKCITVASGSTNARTIKLQMAKYGSGTLAVRLNQGGYYYSTIVVEEVVQ